MERKHLVLVLFALLIASFTTSSRSYRTTEQWVTEDMSQALAQTLAERRILRLSASLFIPLQKKSQNV